MTITSEELPWDSDNVALFRAFLQTPTGQRLVPKLAESRPAFLEVGTIDVINFRAAKIAGFEHAVKNLMALTVILPPDPKPIETYPSLDDDAAHGDGRILNNPET